jgi:hypothetical protein
VIQLVPGIRAFDPPACPGSRLIPSLVPLTPSQTARPRFIPFHDRLIGAAGLVCPLRANPTADGRVASPAARWLRLVPLACEVQGAFHVPGEATSRAFHLTPTHTRRQFRRAS